MARSSADSQPISIAKPPRSGVRVPLGWFWPIFWCGLMVGSGAFGIWAMVWLTRIPPLPDCEEVTPTSSLNNRLICAEAEMQAGNSAELTHAVELTANWPENHALYADAYPVLVEASQRLLKKATQTMHRGELTAAVELASRIPLDTPLRETAQAAIWQWQQEWQEGKTIQKTVEQAIADQDWATADKALQKMKLLSSDYWLGQRHDELQQAKQREQTAWAQINQARTLADTGNPESIGQALTLAQHVNLTSEAWTAAQEDIDRWSQNLLLYSFQRWELGDVEGAIAAVQKVPPDPDLAPEARDLIQFSHAKQLADKAAQQNLGYIQLFQLMEAIRAVEQINYDSTFYKAAQQSLKAWQAQLEDLRTLQFANAVTGLRQAWAFKYATDLAWTVDPTRPRRLQAQTLIAHWENEVERIEDRPYLLRANSLANKATVSALQAAIAEARKVALGRALRIDAQTAIAAWLDQIEIIQDQPILNEANSLASEEKLQDAIEVAEQIEEDRALYDEAQAMIQDWTRTIQIQEDTPLLEEAKSLAYIGSLTRAINLASQIAPGRALYAEAQNAIALWRAEREYIRNIRATEAENAEAGSRVIDEDFSPASEDSGQSSDSAPPSQPPPPNSSEPAN